MSLNKLHKIFFIFIISFQFILETNAQLVPVYSQYLVNQSIINPAYIGIDNCLNVNALYRQQWFGFEGSPSTRTISAHTPLRNRKLAVGANIVNDVIGVASNTLVEGQFCYRIKVGDKAKVSFGMGAGLFINKNNLASLKVNDNGDEVFANNANSVMPTFSFGSYYENKNLFFGVSTLNLTRTIPRNRTFVYQQPLYFLAGYQYKMTETFALTPSVLLNKISNNPINMDLNVLMDFGKVIRFGVSYRTWNSFYGILQFKLNDQLQIGYAYENTFSVLNKYQSGSHEVSVKYVFKYKANTVDVKSFE